MSLAFAVWKRLSSAATVALLVAAGIVATSVAAPPAFADLVVPGPNPIAQRTPAMVSGDVLPTVQIDGVVWSQAIAGNVVYAGGQFANARPAGAAANTNLTPRSNLLAYNLATGVLITGFAPTLNGAVRTVVVSPDKTRVYIGGDFTAVNGVSRYRIAAFDAVTGALVTSFAPVLDAQVKTIWATNTTVYAGGSFSKVGTTARGKLAAFSASNGALMNWAPVSDYAIQTLVGTPDASKIIVGGSFQHINSAPAYGLAAIDSTTGLLVSWPAAATVQDAGANAGIFSLSSDGTNIFGTGWVFGAGGNLEGTFSTDASGNIRWIEDCHGDTYGAYSDGTTTYTVSHAHYCATVGGFPQSDAKWSINQRHALAFSSAPAAGAVLGHNAYGSYTDWYGSPAPQMYNWFPDPAFGNYTSQGQAAWDITGNGQYLIMGGEFPSVSGVAQQGIVRFAVPSIAPNKRGPKSTGGSFIPTLVGQGPGRVRVSFPLNSDIDDLNLAYNVYRDGGATPVYTKVQASPFWGASTLGFVDSGLTPGSKYTYKVTAADADGNVATGSSVSITASSIPASAYTQNVVNDGAEPYWRLGESAGTVAVDYNGFLDGTVGSTVTRGAIGAIGSDTDTASSFDGSATGTVIGTQALTGPNTFSAEVWINTATARGGKILGFGNSNSGESSSYDRHIYMDNAGHIFFGVYPGGVATVNSVKSYNDGQWHHIVATLGPDGMNLYIDDVRVANRSDVTFGQGFTGYWRVGGDSLGGWPNQPTSDFFQGTIDDVAIYPTVLTRNQVDEHWVASGRVSALPAAPADPYGAAVFNSSPTQYWRLGEPAGPTAADSSPSNGSTGTYTGGVTFGVQGAVPGTINTAVTLNGSDGAIYSNNAVSSPTVYSEELWFKTNTSSGGKLIGFGSSQTGASGSYDRHVWMLNSGQLVFGVWTGQTNTISSTAAYNDGQWHHMVATQASDGMKLYVDGQLTGTNPQASQQAYTGYWRVGGDTTWGGNSSNYFAGTIDEVAVYNTELSASDVANHFTKGGGALPNQLPSAAFTSTTGGLTVAFDGSTSVDPDGSVASYSWNFGDGSPLGTGVTPSHLYSAAGTWPVALTVTDDRGGTNTVNHSVVTTHASPVAAFTTTPNGLTVGFGGSATTSDAATLTRYSWNFGDGSATVTGQTVSHVFADGTARMVTLTVTDSYGASSQVTQTVTPSHAAPVVSFTSGATDLSVSFASAASASDGATVTGYSWDFGDGSAAVTTSSPTYVYGAAGSYSVSLKVTDSLGGTNTATHQVTVVAANQLPSAAFTSTTGGLTVAFDGSTSVDPDGSVASYSWNFGDGSPLGTGVTPSHLYSAAGTWPVALTVTDDRGGTNTVNHSVVTTHASPVAAFTTTPNGLTVGFGGSATTSDAATLTRYSWNFGDGSATVTGQTVSHVFADGTARMVTLTVTDSYGASSQVTQTVTPSHAAPVVSFTSGATDLSVSFASAASASDGATVTGYSWDFGDGSAAVTTSSPTYVYGAAGSYSVSLKVTDSLGGTNTATHQVTVAHANPIATFTSTTNGLIATFSASARTSGGASVSGYSWNFGDGSAVGSGLATSHTYAAGGTYTVALTVLDNSGGTATVTQAVTVSLAFAADVFGRTSASGWGSADIGGAWTVSGAPANYSVGGGTGKMKLPTAGSTMTTTLGSVSRADVDLNVSFTTDLAPTGGGIFFTPVVRKVGTTYYSAKLTVASTGKITAYLTKVVSGTETTLKSAVVTGLTFAPGSSVRVRFQAIGSGTTTLNVKAWNDGTSEPTAWTVSTTDSTAALQTAGSIGLIGYVSASSTNAPVIVSVTNLKAVVPSP